MSSLSHFDRTTALVPASEGRFTGEISEDFWVQAGPNGGYLSAIAMRGALCAVPEPSRAPRTLHVRFLSPPKAGPFELTTRVLRRGRAMTSLSIQMEQHGNVFLEASASFSEPFGSVGFQDAKIPTARPLDQAEPIPKAIPLNHRYDMLRAIGAPLRTGERALTGGYIRFADPRHIDVLALAALWDAWPPAVFARAIEQRFRGAVPTVEVSVFFRAPTEIVPAGDYALLQVESTHVRDGFMEEDAQIWSTSGVLLAQSRQVALLI